MHKNEELIPSPGQRKTFVYSIRVLLYRLRSNFIGLKELFGTILVNQSYNNQISCKNLRT